MPDKTAGRVFEGLPRVRLPPLVQLLLFVKDPVGQLHRWHSRHGVLFVMELPATGPMVVVGDPQAADGVLRSDPDDSRAGAATGRVLPMLGAASVLRLDGEAHHSRRHLLSPVFHGHSLENHREFITELTDAEVATWPAGQSVQMLPAMRRISFAVAARLVLGIDNPARVAALHRLVRRSAGPAALPDTWLWPLSRTPRWACRPLERRRRSLNRFLSDELGARLHQQSSDHALGQLMTVVVADETVPDRSQGQLTASEIYQELRALLVVGHETTAAALAWSILRIAAEPELLSIDGGLTQLVRHLLHWRPPVVDAVRELKSPITVCGCQLPASALVMVSAELVHNGKPPAAEQSDHHGHDSIPFGGGVRRCLGATLAQVEIETVLEAVFERVTLTPEVRWDRPAPLVGTVVTPVRRTVNVDSRPGPLAEP